MENKSKAAPEAIPQLTLDHGNAPNELIELAQGYMANAELSLFMMKEFGHVDAEGWLKLAKSA